MFISVTFPIADFRGLHGAKAGRLDKPCWGAADPRAAFARGFGAIHTRTKSGSGFVGENYYADCNNLVKYPAQFFLTPLLNHDRRVLSYPLYRRFYFDGQFSGRFEFGFRLNEASLYEIKRVMPSAQYDVTEIAKQILTREIAIHLLDDRTVGCFFYQAMLPLRDGYIISSTKTASLKIYDIAAVGSSYVSVGSPFVFIRSSPTTKISPIKQKRDLTERKDIPLLVTRSGVHKQNFDTAVMASVGDLDSESPQERLARLFYSQIRALTFAHSFYLRQIDDGKIAGPNGLQPAIQALLERIKGLVPLEGVTDDREICSALEKMISNADIDTAALAREIEARLKKGRVRKIISRFFGYVDKKADIAIEAAASTATKQLLTGGL